VPAHWFVEVVTVQPHAGEGAYGAVYGDPVTVLGHLSGGRRVSRGAQNEEVTSEVRVMLPNPVRLADGSGNVDAAGLLTAQSLVTSGAYTATVDQVTEHRQPGTGRLVYVSAALT
ncbi:MAG TPA: hypothetical protein VD864_00105, partial [Nocardioides sp.]|nr:hypothetical protein [Nocardioides sp.]